MEGYKPFDYSLCTKEEYKDDSKCQFKDFTGKNYQEFVSWVSTYNTIKRNVTYSIIAEGSKDYIADKSGLIKSITLGGNNLTSTSIYEAKDKKIVVTYYALKTEDNEDDNSVNN